jgi:hypothetical protein
MEPTFHKGEEGWDVAQQPSPYQATAGVVAFCLVFGLTALQEGRSNQSPGLDILGGILIGLGLLTAFRWLGAKYRDARAERQENSSNPTH